ncbi:MAG: ribose-phosphate diphosphokinase [Myxococcales bacterium]|nr:ribose-phosphate diphosphokinase [Myxococcales bacterium]
MKEDLDRRAPMCLVACGAAEDLATRVAEHLHAVVTPSSEEWFACGEAKHVIHRHIRGCDCYVFQQAVKPGDSRSIYDRTMAMLHAVDAARVADVDRVTVVMPYLPGTRQDKRKGHLREGVTTGLMARLLQAAGVGMVLTVQPHNEAISGCYDPARCVLEAVTVTAPFARFLQDEGLSCDVVASTDVGGLEMARAYAQVLGRPIAALSKERDYSTSSTVLTTSVIGDVAGRSVLIVDDIVDTAGSVVSAVRSLWEKGATDVVVAAVHLLLSGPAWQRLKELRREAVERGHRFVLAGTSSVIHPDAPDWMVRFDLEPLLARVIRSVNTRGSVRALEEHRGR